VRLLVSLAGEVGDELATSILDADQDEEPAVFAQRQRVARLEEVLRGLSTSDEAAGVRRNAISSR